MNKHNCEPCTRLQKNQASVQWCINCQELLCTDCYCYHKNALTATKKHSFLTIEQYQSNLPMLKSVQTTCSKHPEKEYEYFCKDHACICCFLCKKNKHFGCKDVEKIEEALADVDLKGNFNQIKNEISKSVRNLKKLCADRDENISKLQEQKERLFADIKANRYCIECALNEFETDIKNKIERNFDKEADNLLKQRNELSVKISDSEKRLNLIKSFSETEFLPNMYLFLLYRNTKKELFDESAVIENFVKTLKYVKSDCNVSVEINKENMCLKMIKTFNFSNNTTVDKFDLKREEKYDVEESEITSSSTIEEDDALNIAAELSTTFVLPIANKSFRYAGDFHLKSTDSKTGIRFIKAISHNRILIGRKSDTIMTVYDRSGKALGEIKTKYPVTAVAVIDNNTIAAAAYRAVVFANTNTYRYDRDYIMMEDTCFGLALVDNNLIVNCVTKGVTVMSLEGNITKKFGNIKGEMQICELENKIVAFIKTDSPVVERVNIATLSKLSDIDLGLIGRTSLTTCMGNVLISTRRQHKVCAIKIRSEKCDCETILDANDGINEPICIDFDMKSKQLLLINHGGKSVYIFKMQVDKTSNNFL